MAVHVLPFPAPPTAADADPERAALTAACAALIDQGLSGVDRAMARTILTLSAHGTLAQQVTTLEALITFIELATAPREIPQEAACETP